MTAIGATAVVVTAVRNDHKLWTISNIGSTIILWWSLFLYNIHLFSNTRFRKKNMLSFLFKFINQNSFNIALSVDRSIKCLRYGKAMIWPIVGGGGVGPPLYAAAIKVFGGLVIPKVCPGGHSTDRHTHTQNPHRGQFNKMCENIS